MDVTPSWYGGPGEPYLRFWMPVRGGVMLDDRHYSSMSTSPGPELFLVNPEAAIDQLGLAYWFSVYPGSGILPSETEAGSYALATGLWNILMVPPAPGVIQEGLLDASGTVALATNFATVRMTVKSLLCADSGGPVDCQGWDEGEGFFEVGDGFPPVDFVIHTRDTGSVFVEVSWPGAFLLLLGGLAGSRWLRIGTRPRSARFLSVGQHYTSRGGR